MWTNFQKFVTIDKFYHFRVSKLFENLFQSITQEASKMNYHIPEEERKPGDLNVSLVK